MVPPPPRFPASSPSSTVITSGKKGGKREKEKKLQCQVKPASYFFGSPNQRLIAFFCVSGTTTSTGFKTDDEALLGKEVVEDIVDEQVGAMSSTDASRNAEYLAQTVQGFKAHMATLFDNGTNSG